MEPTNMQPTNSEIYAYQLLHFFVTKHQYQIVTIKQQRKDIWLMNAANQQYPVIRLSAYSNMDTLANTDYLRNAHRAILDIIHRESKLYIINTSEESTPVDNDFMKQVLLHPGVLGDEQLKEFFPGVESVVHKVEDNQKEYAKITRSLEEMQIQMLKKQRKAQGFFKQIPKLTGILVGICVAVWVIAQMMAFYLENDILAAILCGAYYKMNIVSMHEYWRFFTSGFLHMDVFHLLMNMIALISVGRACEAVFKRYQYLTILCVSIIVGNFFVYIVQGNLLGLGISGGIFGLLGAFIVTLYENGSIKHPMVKASVFRLILMNLMISLLPGISMAAHLGGFVSGAFLGLIFVPSKRWEKMKFHAKISFTILLGLLCGLAMRINIVDPLYKDVDTTLYHTVRALGLDWYADSMYEHYLEYYPEEVFQ